MYFADIASSLYFWLENCAGWGARSIMPEKVGDGNGFSRSSVHMGNKQKTQWLHPLGSFGELDRAIAIVDLNVEKAQPG